MTIELLQIIPSVFFIKSSKITRRLTRIYCNILFFFDTLSIPFTCLLLRIYWILIDLFSLIYSEYAYKIKRDNYKSHLQSEGLCSRHVIIHSSKRNHELYPNVNRYEYKLSEKIRNVYSIELIKANIPNTAYTISNYNNCLFVQTNDSPSRLIKLQDGIYDVVTFIGILNETFLENNVPIECKFNAILSKIVYTPTNSSTIKIFLNLPNSPINELGFPPETIIVSKETLSSHRIDLFGTRHINIHLEDLPTTNDNNVLETIMCHPKTNLITYTPKSSYRNTMILKRAVDIHKLSVYFSETKNGKEVPYDFNGVNHSLVIRFNYDPFQVRE